MAQVNRSEPTRQAAGRLGFLRLVWAQVALALVVGVILSYIPPEWPLSKIGHEIGVGLIVAAIVTAFWQLREVSEYFLSLAKSTLVQDEYVRKLNLQSLRRLRAAAASAILDRRVDSPNYKWEQLEEWVENVLFQRNLPSEQPGSGIYREDFHDIISLEFITLEEALKQVDASTDNVLPELLSTEILKQTTITRYTARAPRKGGEGYEKYIVSLSGKEADMPSFLLQSRVRFWVGKTQASAHEVTVQFSDIDRGGVEFRAEARVPFDNGETPIWTKTIEYKMPGREPFIVETVAALTHNLSAQISVTGKHLVLDGNVLGFGGATQIDYPPNGLALRYSGWLFEDHGYYVWWWV